MRNRRTAAYAIGGVSVAIAAIVITASTAGLGPVSSEGVREQLAAPVSGTPNVLVTATEDDDGGDENDEDERHERHEDDDDDDD